MSEHSPGPWVACKDGKCPCGQIWNKTVDMPVATVERGDWGDEYAAIRLTDESILTRKAEAYMEKEVYGHIPIEAAEANARLIARAPEMQAKIDKLQELLREWATDSEEYEISCPWVEAKAIKHPCGKCLFCRTRKELEPTDGS